MAQKTRFTSLKSATAEDRKANLGHITGGGGDEVHQENTSSNAQKPTVDVETEAKKDEKGVRTLLVDEEKKPVPSVSVEDVVENNREATDEQVYTDNIRITKMQNQVLTMLRSKYKKEYKSKMELLEILLDVGLKASFGDEYARIKEFIEDFN